MAGSRFAAAVAAALAVMLGMHAPRATAQAPESPTVAADRLFAAGRFAEAERIYYAAVRKQPRDPAARIALARYLGARGRWRVASVLLEEARRFGGDSAVVARLLAPLYERSGDWRLLATLAPSPLARGERQRAEALALRRYAARGADSAVVPLAPGRALGTITVLLGGDTVRLVVDPAARGLALDASAARLPGVQGFAERDGRTLFGIAGIVTVGGLRLTDVPVRFAALGQRGTGVVGLDFLGDYTPTFDERAATLTLRLAPPARFAGTAHEVSLERVSAPRGSRWTLDARRGRLWVE